MSTANRYSERRAAVRERARAAALEFVLVTSPANVRYLCGFTGSSGWLLLAAEAATLLTDGRYADQAATQTTDVEIAIAKSGLADLLGDRLGRAAVKALGFEGEHVSFGLQRRLVDKAPVEWRATRDLVEHVRASKDESEVEAIRRALRLAESVLVEAAAEIGSGRCEREVAAEIEYACRRGGAEGMAFETIVASGPRTALPHAGAGERCLGTGEPVMIDVGCRVDGYCSDITRMLWLGGKSDGKMSDVHEVVAAAQNAAIETIRAGIPAAEVDRAARRVIEKAGFGEAFVHGTGHGVGLEIHEAPAVSGRSNDTLSAGMVITVEPAVYLPGEFGVRIEDMVCVREDGCDRLTTLGAEPMLA